MTISTQAKKYFEEYQIAIILVAIFALGAFLRFKGLTFQSYWLDELYSADFANPEKSIGAMFQQLKYDPHPPLYTMLLRIAYQLFGYTEFTGRVLSAVLGCLTVLAVYFLGKELFNKYIGLYAAFIASTNYFLIFYSQETRSYSLLCLFSVFSTLFFSKVLAKQTKKNILLYWGSTIILMHTHYIGFFLIAGQVFFLFYYLFNYSEKRKKLIRIAAGTAIVLISALLPLVEKILMNLGREISCIHQPSPIFFIIYIYSYFHSKYLLVLFAASGFFSVLSLILRKYRNTRKINDSIILLLVCIVAGYLLPYIKGVISAPMLGSPRYTIILLPAIILLVSWGIWRLSDGWKRMPVLLIIAFFSFHALRNYYEQPIKSQAREVIREIEQYQGIPVYSAVPFGVATVKTNHYQTYADLLHMNMKISGSINLKNDLESNSLPDCFWVIDFHSINNIVARSKKINVKIPSSFYQVYKTDYRDATGILFSSYENPATCSGKIGLQLN